MKIPRLWTYDIGVTDERNTVKFASDSHPEVADGEVPITCEKGAPAKATVDVLANTQRRLVIVSLKQIPDRSIERDQFDWNKPESCKASVKLRLPLIPQVARTSAVAERVISLPVLLPRLRSDGSSPDSSSR